MSRRNAVEGYLCLMLGDYLLDGFRFNEKRLAVRVDPFRQPVGELYMLCSQALTCGVDMFLVWNDPMPDENLEETLLILNANAPSIPIILIQQSPEVGSHQADAVMVLNAMPFPIQGQENAMAVLPTGYIVLEGSTSDDLTLAGTMDTAGVVAKTVSEFQQMGYSLLYLDAGVAVQMPVPFAFIQDARKVSSLPLFVGGGIKTPDQANEAARAGADIIVVDASIVLESARLPAFCQAVHSAIHLT